jgi:hypothetical protein
MNHCPYCDAPMADVCYSCDLWFDGARRHVRDWTKPMNLPRGWKLIPKGVLIVKKEQEAE